MNLRLAAFAITVAAAQSDNPLLQESALPYQFPPFDKIRNEHFQPAIEQGMAEQLKEVEQIAANGEDPTFENTIVALERTGQLLERAASVFFNLEGTHTNPEMQRIDKELSPKLAAHRDAILLDGRLFARVEGLYTQRNKLGLDAESKYLLERYYKDFVRAGARLSEPDKAKLKTMNMELADLSTRFAQNVLKGRNDLAILVDSRAELDGLPENEIAAAAAAAKEEKQEGKFLIRLLNTTGQPPLSSLKNRALRKRIMEASLARNNRAGEFDNREVVLRMARIRAERATLLGYASHAAYQLEEQTAANVANVKRCSPGSRPRPSEMPAARPPICKR
jgi:peptidyl-dipeptidase Dcp